MSLKVAATAAAGIALLLVYRTIQAYRNRKSLPPSPPAHPFIGHLLKIPAKGQEEYFHELAKTYGDIIHLRVLGRNIIIIDTHETAMELLDQRSAIYSSRPNFTVYELLGWFPILPFLEYGKRFIRHRKVLQDYFGRQASISYRPNQAHEARVLIKNLLAKPEKYDFYFNRFATAIVIKIAYGHSIVSDDDFFMKLADEIVHSVNSAGPAGNTPPDMFPILKHFPSWFPGTYYAHFARKWSWVAKGILDYPYDSLNERVAEGIAEPSVLSSELDKATVNGKVSDEDLVDIKGIAAAIQAAGADTTWSSLGVFVVAMLRHPEIQSRAQKEIDDIVGTDRLPDFNDQASLVYVTCIMHEVWRWYPTVHFGVPHKTTEDDTYRGYHIPKGSIVFANTAGMCLDENIYSNPLEFNPSRYLPKPEGNGEPYPVVIWGYGRRICPGRYLADASFFISLAMILATLTITKAKDEDGKEINPELTFSVGVIHHPNQVPCVIKPRSKAAERLILEA
ncbi:cytochrome P450 [Mycena floridula]|nr:cytochrome P450 [Mycena floridula]